MSNKVLRYVRKCLAVLPAVPICALGVVLFVKANWGSDPLTMFELGLSNTFSITLGVASLVFEGSMFVLFFFLNRKLVNFGTFAFCFGIKPCIDFFTPIVDRLFNFQPPIAVNSLYILLGSILICVALAYYIPMDLGYQTSDIFALSVGEWFHLSYGVSLTIVYLILFIVGFILNGPWGIGTIISIVAFGPIIDRLMKVTASFSYKLAGITA